MSNCLPLDNCIRGTQVDEERSCDHQGQHHHDKAIVVWTEQTGQQYRGTDLDDHVRRSYGNIRYAAAQGLAAVTFDRSVLSEVLVDFAQGDRPSVAAPAASPSKRTITKMRTCTRIFAAFGIARAKGLYVAVRGPPL